MNAMLTKSWKLVVATAVFCVATTSSPSYAATLTHRWTFNSDYKDAVGNADATLGGNGSVSLSNGKAVLAGGNGELAADLDLRDVRRVEAGQDGLAVELRRRAPGAVSEEIRGAAEYDGRSQHYA